MPRVRLLDFRYLHAVASCCCVLMLLGAGMLAAQQPPGGVDGNPEAAVQDEQRAERERAIVRLEQGGIDLATLAEALPALADIESRARIRTAVLESESVPQGELVALLEHPYLAVRIAALELLEEQADGDFDFTPWLPPDDPGNRAALERWRRWAEEPPDPEAAAAGLNDERALATIRDLLSDDADKAARARRIFESEGLAAVARLEQFLIENPGLGPGQRARIREAQYQATLTRHLGDQAALTARHLAFGNRDQVLAALGAIRAARLLAIPILRDFIENEDPLIRETAIDSLLVIGGSRVLPIVVPVLQAEPDINVIHGALRRLKDVREPATIALVTGYLKHPDEDILISAIQSSLALAGESASRGAADSAAMDAGVVAALNDSRWRVRAAALEYVGKRRLASATEKVLELLKDEDEFVRFAAISAAGSLSAEKAIPLFGAMFRENPDLAGPVFAGYAALNQSPGPDLLLSLDAATPEVKIAALRAVGSGSVARMLAARYAADANLDVSCSALQVIASNSEVAESPEHSTLLVNALRENRPEKDAIILGVLKLQSLETLDPALMEMLGSRRPGEPTILDPLYDAFLLADLGDAGAETEIAALPEAEQALVDEVTRRLEETYPPELRFRAALVLAGSGRDAGIQFLTDTLADRDTSQKVLIGAALYDPSTAAAIPLLRELLRDPIAEVRQVAASSALSNEDALAIIEMVLQEVAAPDAALQPDEVYDYSFESASSSGTASGHIRSWGIEVLGRPASDTSVALRVLACIPLRHAPGSISGNALRRETDSTSALVRRAAWHSLLAIDRSALADAIDKLPNDADAFVREVLPHALQRADDSWLHRFSDSRVADDASWNSGSKAAVLNDAARTALERMAEADSSEIVRFQAMFALVTQGFAVDFNEFLALVVGIPADREARAQVVGWLEENAARATPSLRPLLVLVEPGDIDPRKLEVLHRRIGVVDDEMFSTFASLVDVAAVVEADAGAPLLTAEEPADANSLQEPREFLEVVYFYKPSCQECVRAQQALEALKKDFPALRVTRFNILEPEGTLRNQAYCLRFHVPSARHSVTPAVFTQGGFLIREDVEPASLARLFRETMAMPQDDSWMTIDRAEKARAAAKVDQRFAAFTLPVVIIGGLTDGLNPCAFATIIFFLSYLQIARRTPREMLMVGGAFILAVFLAYFAAGLALHSILASLNDRFADLQRWLNGGFATLALLAAFFSFRDAQRARSGRLDEMTLQLPGMLKSGIRHVARRGARARWFVLAAFLAGIVISFLELACTGQIYAPIIYQIQQGKLDAVRWLLIYNVAFIMPLVVIFALAYGGLRSERLIEFQKTHTASVKIAIGILFLVLAVFILFGQRLLHP